MDIFYHIKRDRITTKALTKHIYNDILKIIKVVFIIIEGVYKMKKTISLVLILILTFSVFGSWQIAHAATTDRITIKVGDVKTIYPDYDSYPNSYAWSIAGISNALEIVSETDYSCTVRAVAPTGTSYAIVRYEYNYIEYYGNFPYLRTGFYDCYVTVTPVAPTSVTVSPSSVNIVEGSGRYLKAVLAPSGATTDLSWSSSNTNVVTVDSDGWISGRNAGTAKVTVRTSNGKSDYCSVTVSPGLKELDLDSKLNMFVGNNKTLHVEVTPSNASGFSLSWSSSDTDVVRISSKSNSSAVLSAVGEGVATITASANGKSASCEVTVKRPNPESVTLPSEIWVLEGKIHELVAEILPAEADKSVTWSSSNSKVAAVSDDGKVTGIKEGTATITAKTSNKLTAKCKVNVVSHLPQNIIVSKIDEKTYGDEPFKVEVVPDKDSGLNDFTYSSSNTDVAGIDGEGNVTIKAAGKTNITVSQEGDETYAPFTKTYELVVNKKPITITANEVYKKVDTSDPEFTYTVTGELVNGDIIIGELSRKAGEKVGSYPLKIGTLAINDNYDITFVSAKLEIVDRLPQNIVISEIPPKTYGDDSFKIEVTPDEVTGLSEFTFSSSNSDVAEIDAEGNVTIKAAGETNISVKEAGSVDFAPFKKTLNFVVNKKDIEVTAIDLENETVIFKGVLDKDTAPALKFKSLKLELVKVNGSNATVKVSDFVLVGDNAENYNVITETLEQVISSNNVVTVSLSSDKNGSVEGSGSYIKGSKVTIKATPDKGYKFKGWYEGKTRFSTKKEYSFVPEKDITLVAEFEKSKQSSGGGGGGSSGGGGGSSGGGGSTTQAIKYKVVFITNGGIEILPQNVSKDSVAKKPAEPTKSGFAFDGWYTDKECTVEYDFNTKISGGVTLYAKWADPKKRIVLKISDKKANVFGEEKENDVAPRIVNDRTMLPIRFIAENLGAEVIWTAEESDKVVVKKEGVEIVIRIGSDKAFVNGVEVALDSTAFIENGRTYLPVRFVSENLGADVRWVGETQQVIITKK